MSINKFKNIANKLVFERKTYINDNMLTQLIVKNLKLLILTQVKHFINYYFIVEGYTKISKHIFKVI